MFFTQINKFGKQNAVFDGSEWLSYQALDDLVQEKKTYLVKRLGHEKQVVALTASNTLLTLVNYLALLQLKQTIFFIESKALLTEQNNESVSLCERFKIRYLLNDEALDSLPKALVHPDERPVEIDTNIALLMGTSGSTGAAKYVMLSYENLQHNAQDICAYLPIQASDKTITTLPFSYAYGLSIINTHLLKGAAIVMTTFSVMQREFWEMLSAHQVSSFGGVPYTYEMLLRLRFTQKELPSLRYFTQAGGKLARSHLDSLVSYAEQHNKQFFVMYGQTEATARMSFANLEKLLSKPTSIGCAIPNTHFKLIDEKKDLISHTNQEGELVFYGENVMLGYAQTVKDMINVEPLPFLETGDLAICDDQGDYYISGRIKRIIKLFGERFNLDDVQQKAILFFTDQNLACVGDDKHLYILIESNAPSKELITQCDQQRKALAKYLKLNHRSLKVCFMQNLLRTKNGKLDYSSLLNEVMGH